MLLAACNKQENEVADIWNGEIRLASGVVVQTRSTANPPDRQIASGQDVGVFISDAVAGSTVSENLKYDADGSGKLTLAGGGAQPYYPQTGNAVSIYAYHPYNAGAGVSYDFEVKTNQGADNKSYYDSDLLYSQKKEYQRKKDPHGLVFAHKLSKVVVGLTAGSGVPGIAGAKVEIVGAETKGEFTPATGLFNTKTNENGGVQADVQMNTAITSGSYIAIVPPQTFNTGAKFLKVTLSSNGVLYYTLPGEEDLSLQSGKVYEYTITVNLTGLEVASTITDWENVGNVTGTATMQ
jgi:hypothetical protein